MQNAPSFSTNVTNTTPTYVFDENNIRYLNLTYNEQGASFICYNGTGDACTGDYNKQATLLREINPSSHLADYDVSQAYQLPVSAEQYMEVQSDADAGFTTENNNYQINKIAIAGQAPIKMSTVIQYYNVNTADYTDAVYPVNIDAPTKVIQYDVDVEVWNSTSEVTTESTSTL